MSANPDWLAQLAPDRAPPPPGWWPPAPGWWIVLVLSIAVAVAYGVWLRRPGRALRREALRELREIAARGADTVSTARAIQSLLRRYAIAAFGVERAGRLTGEAWITFVRIESGGRLDAESGQSLLAAAFGTVSRDDRERWLSAAVRFVKAGPRRSAVKPWPFWRRAAR